MTTEERCIVIGSRNRSMSKSREVRILDSGTTCPLLPIVEGGGEARAVVWPGVGAEYRSMHRISLPPGGRTIEFNHPMEAVSYVISGEGAANDAATLAEHLLVEGAMIHVEPGTAYRFRAGSAGIELLGGPCPYDPALYATLADA